MAVDHHEDAPETGGRPAGQRAPLSRRAMLRTGASAAGAAGLVASGALTAIPAAAAARPARGPAERTGHPGATVAADAGRAADGPLVIHVRDARTGEMDIFTGTTHTQLRDPELAARLARASR